MSNYIEYKNKITFHPGYYLKETVEESGLTQADFAKRLGTTPKNLSMLINGEQSLSPDIASKLSKLLGTSMSYWLNLQNAFDTAHETIKSDEELEREKKVLKDINYKYFVDHFNFPPLPRKTEEQVLLVRKFLGVASLCTLSQEDLAVSFRGGCQNSLEATTKANVMVQIAINIALETDVPKYDKNRFLDAIKFALTQTSNHEHFLPLITERFKEAGVVLVCLPNLPGSKINGATKRIGNSVLLMVNDRGLYADAFWFTLLHEAGHILNGDYGVSFTNEAYNKEDCADEYASEALIDPQAYKLFISRGVLTPQSVLEFAESINRDPGIVVGRLQNDGYLKYSDTRFNALRKKYKIAA